MSTMISKIQFSIAFYLLCALSMALGWRIRGQFGHEIGAAMPGAMAAMAIVLLSGRDDWYRRIHYFALLGALGWAFGGSISYMKVVGYTHSSDSATVLYGFAGLYLIGFVWASLGGAGTALAATLDSQRLASLFPPLAAVLLAWFLQDIIVDWTHFQPATAELGSRVVNEPGLAKYDADWLQAAVAIAAVLALALLRRRFDFGTSLVLHLAVGWWAAFGGLVLLLGLRLNPPRGDDWAGIVGVFAGLVVFCWRHNLRNLVAAGLTTGFLGAAGFCAGQVIKLACISTGAEWGWHAVMEWVDGLFFGVVLAIAITPLIRRGPVLAGLAMPRWIEIFTLFFLLWVVPYLNFRKTPIVWLKGLKTLPAAPFGVPFVADLLPSKHWVGYLDAIYLLFGIVLLTLLIRQYRRPAPAIPPTWAGKGQLLYLVSVWFVTLMSFAHVIPRLSPVLLVMHSLLVVNGLVCTWLVVVGMPTLSAEPSPVLEYAYRLSTKWRLVLGLGVALISIFGGWELKRVMYRDKAAGGQYRDKFAPGFYMNHIRFGPDNTNEVK